MKITKTLYITNRAAWREWLQLNHGSESEVWLIYYKKHSGRPRIPYDDAVEEALCFGWIDSIVKRIDDEKFVQRFTPRKENSQWSELNKRRVRRLIEEGKMTKAGLARISEEALKEKESKQIEASSKSQEVPSWFKKALKGNHLAMQNFSKMAGSYRRDYVRWVGSAKRQETRERRLKKAIELLEENKKLGMK